MRATGGIISSIIYKPPSLPSITRSHATHSWHPLIHVGQSCTCLLQCSNYARLKSPNFLPKRLFAIEVLRHFMRMRMSMSPMLFPPHLRDCRHSGRCRRHINGNFLLNHDDLHDLVPESRVHRTDDRFPWQKRVGCRGRRWCWRWSCGGRVRACGFGEDPAGNARGGACRVGQGRDGSRGCPAWGAAAATVSGVGGAGLDLNIAWEFGPGVLGIFGF